MDSPSPQMDKSTEESSKKSPFDELSKDELVKKCKGLLIIAQKAKLAKSEILTEHTAIKERCQQLENQKLADKESLKTMQEFVDTLTEQKLNYTIEIDSLKKQNAQQNTKIKLKQDEIDALIQSHAQQLKSLKDELFEAGEKLSKMDIDVTSLKRQNVRLEKDNEDLMVQLDLLEKEIETLNRLGLEQRTQLLELEQNSKVSDMKIPDPSQLLVDNEQTSKEFEFYKQNLQQLLEEKTTIAEKFDTSQAMLVQKSDEFAKMEQEFETLKTQLAEKCRALTEADEKFTEKEKSLEQTLKLFEMEKIKKDRLNAKLKLYKEKIIKCSSSITQLKNSKFILLKTVSEYSESVPKWQKDILNASKLLSEQLLTLENENNLLKDKLSNLATCEVEASEIDRLKMEKDAINEQLQSTSVKMKEVEDKQNQLIEELKTHQAAKEAQLQISQSLESEKLILINEKMAAREQIQKTESEKVELQNICEDLNNTISALKSEIKSVSDRASLLDEEKKTILKELELLRADKETSEQALITTLNDNIAALKLSLVSVEEENKLLREANDTLTNKVDSLTASLDEPNPEMYSVVEHNNMLQADISKIETKMAAYKSENASLLYEMKESRVRLADLEATLQEFNDVKSKLSNYKSENVELLNEMKEINQVLKERGETISRQDMDISELNRRIKVLDEDLKKAKDERDSRNDEIKQLENRLQIKESRLKLVDSDKEEKLEALKISKENLEALLNERDSIIISLNEDIERLKSNQGNFTSDAPSESMSISTVSRVEETSRLKDLDESFEDRYAKLRLLALKLKKKIGELTIQLKTMEEEKSKLEQDKREMAVRLESAGNTSKNIQTIQSEYDKVIDKLEQKDADIKTNDKVCQNLKKTVEKYNEDLAACNEKATKLEKDLDFSKMEKAALDLVVKELQAQVIKLNKEIESLKAKEAEILQLKADLAAKETQLSVEVNGHQSTREALDRAKRDVKKKSVLSLEMEDYERSMKDLTNKMEENKKKIIQMESTIDTQDATITSLKTQIKMLGDQLNTEEKITRETKELFNMATENLKEKESVINSKMEIISQLELKLEEANTRSEDLNIQLASALGEKEKSTLSMGHEKLELTAKLKRTENRCSEIEEKLRVRTIELDDLKTEFVGYKVRAQSVLRQNQTKDLSLEENLKEEMATLKAELEALRPELQSTKEELEVAASERSRLASRCSELQTTIQNEREAAANHSQREQQEQKNIKLQMTTLTQCYKKQISDLEERTSEEISNLRKELEFSKASLERANALSKENIAVEKKRASQFAAIGNVPETSHDSASNDSNDSTGEINVALLQREEGEGSESTPSPSPTYHPRASGTAKPASRTRREPVPLEQLLGEDIQEHGYEEGDTEHRLEVALRQIEMQDKRLAHMTDIVAEAEREVARRAQLGEVLKEEVRRSQRALDRALHHHNQEYLKNVIVKFLTLGAGDERCRLVPVLHTILTLSPEEKQQLTAVAKGLDPNSNRGWGSYLPWPGKS